MLTAFAKTSIVHVRIDFRFSYFRRHNWQLKKKSADDICGVVHFIKIKPQNTQIKIPNRNERVETVYLSHFSVKSSLIDKKQKYSKYSLDFESWCSL